MLATPSIEIAYRYDFGKLCNTHGVRVAVEVGTDQGVFARHFMEDFAGDELICVDDYTHHLSIHNGGDRTPDMLMWVAAMSKWHGRVRLVKQSSIVTARRLADIRWIAERIDFVYIDAQHNYDAVKKDIAAWWPLTNKILAGHDYDEKSWPGVVQAVDEFARRNQLQVFMTDGDPWCKSWYVYK